jgi:hypothetical protein
MEVQEAKVVIFNLQPLLLKAVMTKILKGAVGDSMDQRSLRR